MRKKRRNYITLHGKIMLWLNKVHFVEFNDWKLEVWFNWVVYETILDTKSIVRRLLTDEELQEIKDMERKDLEHRIYREVNYPSKLDTDYTEI